MSLYIEEYPGGKSFVVRGDTYSHKEQLTQLGGKFNNRLQGGPGFIFSNSRYEEVADYVNQVTGGAPVEHTQTITYKLPKPYVGQKIDLHVWEPNGEKTYYYVVHAIGSSQETSTGQLPIVDIVDIIPENGTEQDILNMFVVSGAFQIPSLIDQHEVVFLWE